MQRRDSNLRHGEQRFTAKTAVAGNKTQINRVTRKKTKKAFDNQTRGGGGGKALLEMPVF